MGRFFTIIVIIAAIVGTGWWWLNRPEVLAIKPLRQINTIVAFGDSLTQGVGSTEGNDYVSVLSKKLGRPIINMGVSGDTTAQGYNRLDKVLLKKPDLVILLLGGNDVIQRVPKEQTFSNLSRIITRLHEDNITVVLLGIQGGPLGDPYAQDFKKLSEEHNVTFVPNVLDGLYGRNDLMYDSVHPNDAGYALIADKVYKVVKPLLDYKI